MTAALASGGAVSGLGMIGLAGAIGVGLVFVSAGGSKLLNRDVMPGIVANYRLLPEPWVAPVAHALPFAELAIGLALLAGGQRLAVVPAALLLVVFAAAMAININAGRSYIDCGCGRSQLRQTLSWPLVGRNLALAVIVLGRLLPAPAPGAFEIGIAIAGGASLFVLTLLFNAIGTLAASPLAAKRS